MRRFYVHDKQGKVIGEGARFDEETVFRRTQPVDSLRLFMTTEYFDAFLQELKAELFWLDSVDYPTPKGGH